MMQNKIPNLSYSLQEHHNTNNNVSYEDLLQEVNILEEGVQEHIYEDDYLASELDYKTNYIKKELLNIADYYGFANKKKRKDDLIEDIVLFEKEPINIQKVNQRKKMWKYIEEIKNDDYLSIYFANF